MRSFLSSFVARVLLSVWVLTPGGWHCGSLSVVWSGRGCLVAWGGPVAPLPWAGRPSAAGLVGFVGPSDAWELVRHFSR